MSTPTIFFIPVLVLWFTESFDVRNYIQPMGGYDGNTYFLILCIYFQMLCLLCTFSIISEEDQDKIREILLANDFLYNKHRDRWRDTQSRERKWEELSELIDRDSKDIKQWYQSTRSKLSDIKIRKLLHLGVALK